MPFDWRVFELAKEPEHPEQNQDAWWLEPERGIAAIADGVTSGLFSRQWAHILTRAAVDDWPDPTDEARFALWLTELRRQWNDEIDTSGLAWYQRAKLRDGGFSTLVWLRLLDNDSLSSGQDTSRLEVTAIGDSCLFHVRDDELLEAFPLDSAEQFDASPLVLGSVDLHRDGQLEFERLELSCKAGDLVVLCTDAVAAWALARAESDQPVAWSDYWDLSPQAWAEEVVSLRGQSRMRYDDATLLLLRVGQTAGQCPTQYVRPSITVEEPRPDIIIEETLPVAEDEVSLLAVDWNADPIAAAPTEAPTDVPIETPVETPVETPTDTTAFDFQSPQPTGNGAEDTYEIQSPVLPSVPDAAKPTDDLPPPLPPQATTGQSPPPVPASAQPAPPADDPEDWRDQVNTFSERLFKKVSERLSEGVDKLQEAKDTVVRKIQEKTNDPTDDDEQPKP